MFGEQGFWRPVALEPYDLVDGYCNKGNSLDLGLALIHGI